MTNDTSVLHIHARDNDCYQHSTIASVWCSSKTSSRFLRPYVVSFLTCTHISPPLHQLRLQLHHHHQLSWTCNHRYVCTMFDYIIILFIIIVDVCWCSDLCVVSCQWWYWALVQVVITTHCRTITGYIVQVPLDQSCDTTCHQIRWLITRISTLVFKLSFMHVEFIKYEVFLSVISMLNQLYPFKAKGYANVHYGPYTGFFKKFPCLLYKGSNSKLSRFVLFTITIEW